MKRDGVTGTVFGNDEQSALLGKIPRCMYSFLGLADEKEREREREVCCGLGTEEQHGLVLGLRSFVMCEVLFLGYNIPTI